MGTGTKNMITQNLTAENVPKKRAFFFGFFFGPEETGTVTIVFLEGLRPKKMGTGTKKKHFPKETVTGTARDIESAPFPFGASARFENLHFFSGRAQNNGQKNHLFFWHPKQRAKKIPVSDAQKNGQKKIPSHPPS